VVAVELARRVVARGGVVAALCLIDPPPSALGGVPTDAQIAWRFVQDLVGGGSLPAPVEAVAGLDASQGRPEEIIAAGQRAGLIPADLELDDLWPRFEVFRASVVALARYAPPVTGLPGPATVIRAAATPVPASPWPHQASQLHEHVVAGDHYSLILGDGLPAVGAIISECLRQAS